MFATGSRASITSPLTVYSANPHYFAVNGNPVILLGSGQPLPGMKSPTYTSEIDDAASYQVNYIRFWTNPAWSSTDNYFAWARTGSGTANDGLPKFDLTQWDSNFWNQLDAACAYAQSKNIYVDVMLFDECSIKGKATCWVNNPFNPQNNVNGLNLSASAGNNGNPGGFYDLTNSALMAFEQSYVAKLVSVTSKYPNVIYEVCNEYTGPWNWESQWINYIRANCSNMISINQLNSTPSQSWSTSSVNLVKFHWGTTDPGTTNSDMISNYGNAKAISYDETPEISMSDQTCRGMGWASFVGGGHIHFEDGGDPTGSKSTIQGIRTFLNTTGAVYWQMSPNNSVVTSTPGGSAYTLANPGVEYITYITGSGSGSMKMNLVSGNTYSAQAYNPTTFAFTNLTVSGNTISGIPSYSQDIVIYVKATGSASASSPSLSLTISADKSSAKSGDTITYTVSYKNSGTGDAKNVTVTAPVPSNTTYVSGGTYSSNNVTWAISTVAAGSSGTVTYSVKVN
jgi:uncharacterized repeat protein (TIGR01451 family)